MPQTLTLEMNFIFAANRLEIKKIGSIFLFFTSTVYKNYKKIQVFRGKKSRLTRIFYFLAPLSEQDLQD